MEVHSLRYELKWDQYAVLQRELCGWEWLGQKYVVEMRLIMYCTAWMVVWPPRSKTAISNCMNE
jgi:hypothetical protein